MQRLDVRKRREEDNSLWDSSSYCLNSNPRHWTACFEIVSYSSCWSSRTCRWSRQSRSSASLSLFRNNPLDFEMSSGKSQVMTMEMSWRVRAELLPFDSTDDVDHVDDERDERGGTDEVSKVNLIHLSPWSKKLTANCSDSIHNPFHNEFDFCRLFYLSFV